MAHVIRRKADFSKIAGLLETNECTPEIDGYTFEGLLINTPEEVVFGAGPPRGAPAPAGYRLPLCGACRFQYNLLGLRGSFVDAILFVAVDARTHVPRAGRMESVPNAIPGPEPPSAGTLDMLVGEVFNPDLAEILALPAEETDYIVYATLGPYRSNVLTTRVRAHKSAPGRGP